MLGFPPGRRKPSQQKASETDASTSQQHMLYIAATALVLCIALLLVIFGNRGNALQRCEGVILQPQRSSCLDALAGIERNASVCDLIGYAQLRDSCIEGIAELTSNITLCTQVTAAGDRADCVFNISNSTRNIGYCALVGAPYNSTCAYNIASRDRFASEQDCALIENATLRSECMYLYYYGSAMASKNASYCAALPGKVNMSLLSAIFMVNSSLSSQLMELSMLNATPQSYCYYNLAVLTPNRSLCAFTSGFMNTLCNATLSSPAQSANITNETACNYVPAEWKPACEFWMLSAQAISKRNASLCMQISTVTVIGMQDQYSCISSLAEKYGNASYCAYISNSTVEQDCVMSVRYANSTAG
jgi:hypothetical protein